MYLLRKENGIDKVDPIIIPQHIINAGFLKRTGIIGYLKRLRK